MVMIYLRINLKLKLLIFFQQKQPTKMTNSPSTKKREGKKKKDNKRDHQAYGIKQ
jgi:hypothetical protein